MKKDFIQALGIREKVPFCVDQSPRNRFAVVGVEFHSSATPTLD
jgi:hypothetical protein